LADLWYMGSNFIKIIPRENIFAKDNIITMLENQRKKEIFRVMELPGTYAANRLGVWGIESVMGFHDNELKWYRGFRGGQSNENYIYTLKKGDFHNNPFLNLMNVKYIIGRQGGKGPIIYMENKGCLPRVFTAGCYKVADSSATFTQLRDTGFDYRNTVLLEKAPPEFIPEVSDSVDQIKSAGTANILEYNPNTYVIEADMKEAGFVVISDNYFPAWKALVDGEEHEIYKAYHTLRAVPLKKGKHKIELVYSSKYFNIGKIVTFISILILAGFFIGILLKAYKFTDK
ncbi:MAG: YfhO family protein, partial [bacterium]